MWNQQIEFILGQISTKSYEMSITHKKNYVKLKQRQKYFKIPVIVLSGLNSVFSVGLSDMLDQSTISIITCLISLSCGVITSIELYLKLSETIQKEHQAGKDYGLLHIELSRVLLLNRRDRGVDGIDYLNDVFGKYTSLIQNSQIVIGSVLHHDIQLPREIELDPIPDAPDEKESLV